MIDTIRLILDEGTFTILQPDRFQPNAKNILDLKERFTGRGIHKAVLNPSRRDKEEAGYWPRLTLRHRPPNVIELVIEFSIPKLLFGNNFDEVTEDDFSKVIEALQDKLTAWGVYIFADSLRKAPVASVHYGKNIVLPRFTLCKSIISLLAKAPVQQWLDHNKVEFRNGGHLYKVHTNSFELAFYDKVKDLQQAKVSPKRSYEADAEEQSNLFEHFEVATSLQVLRMEARLNSRTQIQKMLKASGLPDDDLRFFALFRKVTAQKILLYQWKPYRDALPLILMSQRETPTSLMGYLSKQAPDKTMGTRLQQLGALLLIGEAGWEGLRSLWDSPSSGYYRLKRGLEELPCEVNALFSDVEAINTTLLSFEPVKMEAHLPHYSPKAVIQRRK